MLTHRNISEAISLISSLPSFPNTLLGVFMPSDTRSSTVTPSISASCGKREMSGHDSPVSLS